MKIVCWNVRGQYTILHLAARMVANGWDVLIVLEPSSKISSKDVSTFTSKLSHHKIGHCICAVGRENIVVLYRTDKFSQFEAVSLDKHPDYALLKKHYTSVTVFGAGMRQPILITCKALDGSIYRIMSAHAPFQDNSGVAGPYQQGLQTLGEALGVDVLVGDFNTYSKTGGTSGRSGNRAQFDFEIATTAATSKGGHCLDKALLSKRLLTMMHNYFKKEDRVLVKDPIDIEKAMEGHSDAQDLLKGNSGRDTASRDVTVRSRVGAKLTDKLDHKPIEIMLPPIQSKKIHKFHGHSSKKSHVGKFMLKRKKIWTEAAMKQLSKDLESKTVVLKGLFTSQSYAEKILKEHLEKQAALKAKADSLKEGRKFIVGDGNCLYRSIAHLCYGNQNQYAQVRDEIAQYLLNNFHDFQYLDFLSTPEAAMDYFNELLTDAAWGGEFEVFLASLCYGVTIHLHTKDGYDQGEYNPGQPIAIDLFHKDYHFFVRHGA